MSTTPQILVDASDPSSLETAKPYLSEDLYNQIAERVKALSGSDDDEISRQVLPQGVTLRHWCGYWPVDVFVLGGEGSESVGINITADTLSAGEHEALTEEVRSAVHATAMQTAAKIPSHGPGSPHIFIGLTIDER